METLKDLSAASERMAFVAGGYFPPCTTKVVVETEGGICEAASQPASIKMEQQTIEVDEWAEIGNEVSFD